MAIDSLDPRVTRLALPETPADTLELPDLDQWQTYEVFHQQSRGDQHKHVGIVHAPNAEMALVFAKEQYARRSQCVNLWVVRTADVAATEYEDADMFEPAYDKSFREHWGYKQTRELINDYKKKKGTYTEFTTETPVQPEKSTPTQQTQTKPKIIIGKK